MKPFVTLTFGAGLLLAAILRPNETIQLVTVLMKIPVGIINAMAGLERLPQRARE